MEASTNRLEESLLLRRFGAAGAQTTSARHARHTKLSFVIQQTAFAASPEAEQIVVAMCRVDPFGVAWLATIYQQSHGPGPAESDVMRARSVADHSDEACRRLMMVFGSAVESTS